MENDEDDFEVLPEDTPQSTYLRSLGYSSSDFISAPVRNEPLESKFPVLVLKSKSFIVSVRRIFNDLFILLREVIVPKTEYSKEAELIKHCGLLFKENAVLVEECSPPLSSRNGGNSLWLRFLLPLNFTLFVPLSIVILRGKKLASVPVVVFLSFTSICALAHVYRVYMQFNNHFRIKGFVSSLKQFNQKFLKALQFIAENDKNMMKNCSRLAKMEISGYNSFKVVDPSWLHFKTSVVESTVSLLNEFHTLCRILNDLPVLREHHNYLSVCSVDFCELGISGVETESHQAYLVFVNKLKLLLFLLESELLSFIAINLSTNQSNSSAKMGYILSSISNICKILTISSEKIEHSFNRFYDSAKQETLLEKSKIADTIDSNILNVLLETRALAHSTLSAAIQVRNLETFLETKIKTPQLIDKSEISTSADEALYNIEYELLSSERKLKSLARYLKHIEKPLSDLSDIEGSNEAKTMHNQDLENTVKTGIEVGRSDFNPTQPDEVFVGISADSVDKVNSGNDDDFSEEYFMAKVHNRSSKNLIKELKVKLKDKKSEMVKREKVALERQNITDLEDLDNLAFESSDEESFDQEKLEILESPGADFSDNVSVFRISHSQNKGHCTPGKSENSDSLEDDLKKNTLIFESFPLADESTIISEVPEIVTKNCETAAPGTSITAPSDSLIDSERSLCNPLAMSVANISRVWNQELSRTEECFGSESECSSDCDN